MKAQLTRTEDRLSGSQAQQARLSVKSVTLGADKARRGVEIASPVVAISVKSMPRPKDLDFIELASASGSQRSVEIPLGLLKKGALQTIGVSTKRGVQGRGALDAALDKLYPFQGGLLVHLRVLNNIWIWGSLLGGPRAPRTLRGAH